MLALYFVCNLGEKLTSLLHHLKTLEEKTRHYLSPALNFLEYLPLVLLLYEELKHIG